MLKIKAGIDRLIRFAPLSPIFFRSTRYYWSQSKKKKMNYRQSDSQNQPRAPSNPDMNDDSAWHSSGAYMRTDVWLHLLGICLRRVFWSALWSESLRCVWAPRLATESSSSQDPTALFLSVRWSRQAIYLQIKNTILLTKLASIAEGINSLDFLPCR